MYCLKYRRGCARTTTQLVQLTLLWWHAGTQTPTPEDSAHLRHPSGWFKQRPILLSYSNSPDLQILWRPDPRVLPARALSPFIQAVVSESTTPWESNLDAIMLQSEPCKWITIQNESLRSSSSVCLCSTKASGIILLHGAISQITHHRIELGE